MTRYKLISFNIRGRSELARLIFAAIDQEYEDIRIEMSEWPGLYKQNAPFGQLPYLEIIQDDGNVFKLSQSMSIARYLAKEFDLCGKTKYEVAECDMYSEQLNDLFDMMCKTFFETDIVRKNELGIKLASDIIPKCMHIFEQKLQYTASGYLVGNSLTWLDIYTHNILEILGQNGKLILDKFGFLKSHYNMIRSIPSIKKWLEIRPKQAYLSCPNKG